MHHSFYQKSRKEQQRIQLMIALSACFINLCVPGLPVLSDIYIIVILSLAITLSVIAPFFDTPSLRKSEKLIYYSTLFLAEKEKNGIITIHGGALFDYVFVIDKSLNGRQGVNFIFQNHIEGLLNLIATYESKDTDLLKIKGNSYILNERTAGKIGLKTVETDFIQNIILIYNYVNLIIASSIAKARLAFPNLTHIKTFEAYVSQIIERKEFLVGLYNSLKNTT